MAVDDEYEYLELTDAQFEAINEAYYAEELAAAREMIAKAEEDEVQRLVAALSGWGKPTAIAKSADPTVAAMVDALAAAAPGAAR